MKDRLEFDRTKLVIHALLLLLLAGGTVYLGLWVGLKTGLTTLGGLILCGAVPLAIRALSLLVLAVRRTAIELRDDGVVLHDGFVTRRVPWSTVTHAEIQTRAGVLRGPALLLRRNLAGVLRGGTVRFPIDYVLLHRSRHHEMIQRIAVLRETAPARADAAEMARIGTPLRADPDSDLMTFDADAVMARYLEQKRLRAAEAAPLIAAPARRPGFGRKGL